MASKSLSTIDTDMIEKPLSSRSDTRPPSARHCSMARCLIAKFSSNRCCCKRLWISQASAAFRCSLRSHQLNHRTANIGKPYCMNKRITLSLPKLWLIFQIAARASGIVMQRQPPPPRLSSAPPMLTATRPACDRSCLPPITSAASTIEKSASDNACKVCRLWP